ncbi:hypothetical protein ACH437_06365 [Streptomyces xinghaiensis]|uniref:hypothetical protein n=1 Tax=Streptomyces xinghaiensis TaxID=1038928 RepID=UPI0037ABAFE7
MDHTSTALGDTVRAHRRTAGLSQETLAEDAGLSVGVIRKLDGPGGVGKSTVTALLVQQLRGKGLPVYATREPSSSPLGELAHDGTEEYRGMSMACLIAADRVPACGGGGPAGARPR